jgi:outer membrane autotransporter protein
MRATRSVWTLLNAGSAVLFLGATPVLATNANFQDFFTQVCAGSGSPTGDLATRCSETGNGTGDGNLSGDSESSLNPSQTLSSNDVSLAVARSRSQENRERGERLREGESTLGDGSASQAFGRLSLLAHARGEWFETDRADGGDPERGYDGDLWALEVGLDYRFTDRLVMGGIVTYEEADADFDRDLQQGQPFQPAPDSGSMESESWAITLFGVFNLTDNFFVDAALGYRSSEYTFERTSVFQESGRSFQVPVQTEGDPDGDEYWGSLNLGYDFQRGAWSFGPYGGITYATSDIDSYLEQDKNGSGLNMRVDDTDRDSVLTHLGLRASYAISTSNGVWVPQFRAEWLHDFDNDPLEVDATYALDSAQTLYGLEGNNPDDDYFNLGLGLVGILPNGWVPFIDGEIQLGLEDFDRYRLTAGLRKEF